MTTRAKRRASNLREFKDNDDEYRETGSADAGERRFNAMRSKDTTEADRFYAQDVLHGRCLDEKQRRKDILRRMHFDGWKPKEGE